MRATQGELLNSLLYLLDQEDKSILLKNFNQLYNIYLSGTPHDIKVYVKDSKNLHLTVWTTQD